MTDTVTAKLAKWETLTESATEGPWLLSSRNPLVYGRRAVAVGHGEDHGAFLDADAEFIAASRTAMPALLGFVRGAQALADWHETKAHKARTFPGKGHESEMEKVARVHEDAAQRIRALTERIGGEG